MNSNWFFYKKTAGWLGLECPTCSNNKVFEGVGFQGHLIWKCAACGNYLSLKLKEIEIKTT